MNKLEKSLSELNTHMEKMFEYVEKSLHVLCQLSEMYNKRSARPYYPLNDKWALTRLDTGQPFFVNTEDRNITPWIIMGGHWETNVDKVLMSYTKPGTNVIDIGANMGYYTVKLATKLGASGRCWAFEPNPEVNVVCLENIKINALAGTTTLYKFALGDQSEKATLTRSASNMASANLIGEQEADYAVTVDVRRLDDVVPEDLQIDLIKLDAEGYEKKILDGAKATLAHSPDCAIMIELGLERWEKYAPLSDLVSSCGGERELFAVDDMGHLRAIATADLRQFLMGCAFHENYFLVAKRHLVEHRISNLLMDS